MDRKGRIILASGSPRRRELMEQAGYTFTVEVSDADEEVSGEDPGRMVEELSLRKAAAVASLHEEDREACEIIGADTIVVLEGRVLGKPEDEEDAARMLRELSGKVHEVYTGVTVLTMVEGAVTEKRQFHECTRVRMREISEEEILAYIRTGEPMDKAGAYGIQGRAAIFISGIEGDYFNVVGLPVCRLACILG
ncbi:MAG: septum formation protein Maf [Eubacterium sp.]|nr:septum formation protein Maf [Eubacterium sp.]